MRRFIAALALGIVVALSLGAQPAQARYTLSADSVYDDIHYVMRCNAFRNHTPFVFRWMVASGLCEAGAWKPQQ